MEPPTPVTGRPEQLADHFKECFHARPAHGHKGLPPLSRRV